MKACFSSNVGHIPILPLESLVHLKKSMFNVVTTVALSILIGSSSFLQGGQS